MKGYEKVPFEVWSNPALSLQARGLYALLAGLSYQAGRRKDGEAVALPVLADIARMSGCSVSALRGYIAELKATGWLKTMRAPNTRKTLYAVVFDPRLSAEIHASPERVDAEIHASRARVMNTKNTDADASHPLALPVPKLVMIDGQNLAMNALAKVCSVASSSPRFGEVTTAINGSRKTGLGIRDQFWLEVLAAAENDVSEAADLLAESSDPEVFEAAFAAAVERRAQLYRRLLNGATLTPLALQKWWTDLPGMARSQGTGDLASRMRQQAARLREEGR